MFKGTILIWILISFPFKITLQIKTLPYFFSFDDFYTTIITIDPNTGRPAGPPTYNLEDDNHFSNHDIYLWEDYPNLTWGGG